MLKVLLSFCYILFKHKKYIVFKWLMAVSAAVDSELGLCQFYWVSIFVCILRFPGYFHHKVSNPIYACDTIKQSSSRLTSDKSRISNKQNQMRNRTPLASSPSVNIMIIMIRFSAKCNINKASYWSPVAISVLWLVNKRGLSREVSGETPRAMFDQKSLCTVCCLCLGTWRGREVWPDLSWGNVHDEGLVIEIWGSHTKIVYFINKTRYFRLHLLDEYAERDLRETLTQT